jgi:transposase
MAKKRKNHGQGRMTPPVMEPDAAGNDVGAKEIYVAVPSDRDAEPVRCFETLTPDLMALADWWQACRIRTGGLESPGVFWIPLFQILEERGLQVCLVNVRHVKNVPGRKSDVLDCQWLQYLHSVGLLDASFQPRGAVCALRALLRHRDSLVQMSSQHVRHMQKALNHQMNVQLHHVISDLTGATGLAILDTILAGERNPETLAKLRDRRIRACAQTVAKSLVGDYRPEPLFTLRQSLAGYRHCQQLIAECDREIERQLAEFESQGEPPEAVQKSACGRQAEQNLAREHWRIFFGVDLTAIPGIRSPTIQVLLAEVGPDWSKFRNASAFASWLGLCPHSEIRGGKVLSSPTRKVNNRAAPALRLAARSLYHSHSYLGEYYRRMRAKLGVPKAIVAAAHKLARILYHLITTRQPYQESIFAELETRFRQRAQVRLEAQVRALGFRLAPVEG